jgi:periplasmic divalent cation tolerance protein
LARSIGTTFHAGSVEASTATLFATFAFCSSLVCKLASYAMPFSQGRKKLGQAPGAADMPSKEKYHLVLVTCANHIQAKLIARSVVEKRLAACVSILRSPLESHYRWNGKVEKARELLLIIKTTTRRLGALEREVKRLHSYEVPEFIVLPIVTGSKAYLDWIDENT